MAKIEQWHKEAARAIDDYNLGMLDRDTIAQLIADHAPTPAPTEVIGTVDADAVWDYLREVLKDDPKCPNDGTGDYPHFVQCLAHGKYECSSCGEITPVENLFGLTKNILAAALKSTGGGK